MIHEFALEPEALSNWHSVRYFLDNFGFDNGRLISQFPKKWKYSVYQACSECKDVERKRIEEALAKSDHKFIRRGRPFNSEIAWLENAELQHSVVPFRAIIARENPRNHASLLLADAINEDTPLWKVEKGKCIARTSSELARYLGPVLSSSEEILFIDQHFRPHEFRYRNSFQSFMRIVSSNTRLRRLEYHLNGDLDKYFFCKECDEKIARLIPQNLAVRFVRWKQIEAGDMLHARYVLSELGGISVEWGLDEGDEGETTDIKILDNDIYEIRWASFHKDAGIYEYVDEYTVKGIHE